MPDLVSHHMAEDAGQIETLRTGQVAYFFDENSRDNPKPLLGGQRVSKLQRLQGCPFRLARVMEPQLQYGRVCAL
ncbi:MAG: hypothetical protein R2724_32655 [Bryobacterales bacterium]